MQHFVGAFDRSARRQLGDDEEIALVLRRNEPCRRRPEQPGGCGDEARIGDHHLFGRAHQPCGEPRIAVAHPLERAVERVSRAAEHLHAPALVRRRRMAAQQDRRECRRQGQREDQRDDRRGRDRHRELLIEGA